MPLSDLKGDRRTTVEIRERVAEGLQQIGPPIGRIYEEFFNPLVTRTVFVLLRNGQLADPPVELEGRSFKIEYISRFALELKSFQARGFQQVALVLGELEQVFPGIGDNLDSDAGARQLLKTAGVSTDVIATLEAVEEKREQRAQLQQQQMALEMAQAAGQGYKDASGAPEEGSPAKQLMEAAGVG